MMSGKELQEKNSKSNKLAALFFNKGSNKVKKFSRDYFSRICVVFRT